MDSGPEQWELDSDEIASIASEDLHQHRPNRWTGPKSSWRTLTEEERLLWHSMKQLQDQDLSVHLYNAFALKRRARDAATAQDLIVRMENGQDAVWQPPKLWTAWPLKQTQVPNNRLINEQHDEDDQFTFRRQEQTLPSTELEEELSANILRTAKRRFHRRRSKMPQRSIETAEEAEIEESDDDVPGPSSRETSVKIDTADEDEAMPDTYELGSPRQRRRTRPKTYKPVVSTNDDVSYDLLRPSVRHILSQLDVTFSILHNSRAAGVGYLSDSSTEEESDSQSSQKRPRGRPRSESYKKSVDSNDSGASTPATPRKRGRPRKVHIPKEGETQEDMLLRVARESHRRLPATPKDREAAFEEWMRQGDEAIERERSLSLAREQAASQGAETESEGSSVGNESHRKLSRWGLRDWSDVLGAAALAGFSSDAIARTTQRCADLFGEGMVVRKLNEAPVSTRTAIETVEYRPQPIRLSSYESDADDESDAEADLVQRRVASRQISLVRSSHDRSSPESSRGRLSRAHSPAPRRTRSRSGSRSSATAGLLFCPVPSCDRAAHGFSRKANLRRHIELVHQGQTEEVDSDDEVVGAVHVDGFLRPIVPGRGWRGEDAITRKRKRYYGQKSKTASRATSSDREA